MTFATSPPEDLAKYVNYEEALGRFSGSTAILKRLLTSYLGKNPYAELCESLAAGDLETAERHAHSLKGVAGNMSLSALFDVSGRLDAVLKQGGTSPEFEAELKTVFEKTTEYVNWLNSNI